MKPRFSPRFFLWLFVVIISGGAILSFSLLKILTNKVNSPGFKAEIETKLSKAIEGPVQIGQLKTHVGFRPWVSVENVFMSSQEERMVLKAEHARLDVRLRPLFHGEVILSAMSATHSDFLIRRPKGGEWPEVGRALLKEPKSAGSLRVENISLENTRLSIIDEQKSKTPQLSIKTNVSINDTLEEGGRDLAMSGRFDGAGIQGQFTVSGHIKPNLNLAIRLDDMPLPITVNVAVRSTNTLTATLVWNSTGTTAEADVTLQRGEVSRYAIKIRSEQLDVFEIVDKIHSLASAKSSSPAEGFNPFPPSVRWKVKMQVTKLVWQPLMMEKVLGNAEWNGNQFIIENVNGSVSSGTFAGSALLAGRTSTGFEVLTTTAEIKEVEMGPIMFAFSTHPVLVAGRMSSRIKLSANNFSWHATQLAGTVTGRVRSGYFGTGPVLLQIYSRLNLKSLFHSVAGRSTQGLPFDEIIGTAEINNGKAIFHEPLTFKSPTIEMAYTGWAGIDFQSGKGTIVLNPLLGTRNLLQAIPGVSQLILGPSGEAFPLVADISYENGKVESKFRSIKTLAGPVFRIMGNVLRFPTTLLGGKKKKSDEIHSDTELSE